MSRRLAGAVSVLGLLVCIGVAAGGDDLTKPQQKARDAYLAKLQASATEDPIVDSASLAIQGRFVQAVDDDPIYVTGTDPSLSGTVVVAFVVETDGTVSNPNAVWYDGSPKFRNVAMESVSRARYERPALLDGKPVRAYTVKRFKFRGGT